MKRPKGEDWCKIKTIDNSIVTDWTTFDVNGFSLAQDRYIDYLESNSHKFPIDKEIDNTCCGLDNIDGTDGRCLMCGSKDNL